MVRSSLFFRRGSELLQKSSGLKNSMDRVAHCTTAQFLLCLHCFTELNRTTTGHRRGFTDLVAGWQSFLASLFSGNSMKLREKTNCVLWYNCANKTRAASLINTQCSQVLELALDLVPRLRRLLALQIGSLPFSVSLTLTLGIIGAP